MFREGGPHNIRRDGPDRYSMSVSLPVDENGRTARECPHPECSPGYFKVKGGTGITEGQERAYCPYCRHEAEPNDFVTKEQLRYAEDLLVQEAHKGVDDMLKDALGLGPSGKKVLGGGFLSIEMSVKPGHKKPVRRPFEEEVRRDVVCPHCGLDHSVYGLATWCADCGADIFLAHVEAELSVIRAMLGDVVRRREILGSRVAARDIENCLEDTVSVFEAVLKILVRRHLTDRMSAEDFERLFKTIGNAFQSIDRSESFFTATIGVPLFEHFTQEEIDALDCIFQKRHPITHNLGVVDRKYIEKARSAEDEGKEVLVTAEEILRAIEISTRVFASIHGRMFAA